MTSDELVNSVELFIRIELARYACWLQEARAKLSLGKNQVTVGGGNEINSEARLRIFTTTALNLKASAKNSVLDDFIALSL